VVSTSGTGEPASASGLEAATAGAAVGVPLVMRSRWRDSTYASNVPTFHSVRAAGSLRRSSWDRKAEITIPHRQSRPTSS
jgi:hypothetical protein